MDPDEIVREMQRQQTILTTARQLAEHNAEMIPNSGDEDYEDWARHVLAEAGETHIIRHGVKVPLN